MAISYLTRWFDMMALPISGLASTATKLQLLARHTTVTRQLSGGMSWHWKLVHLACLAAFLVQLGGVLEGFLRPTITSTVVEQKNLQDIDFPLCFKICIKPGFNAIVLNEMGYDTSDGSYGYFSGRSRFNRSVFGWAGHTNTSGLVDSVSGIYNRISLNASDVFVYLEMYTMTDEVFNLSLDHVLLARPNYPHNCFTLDLTNNTIVKERGLKQVYLAFCDLDKQFEVHPQGCNLYTDRNIKAHNFYSSGPLFGWQGQTLTNLPSLFQSKSE